MTNAQPAPRTQGVFDLTATARQIRRLVVEMLYRAQLGHPGGSLSAVEILTVLYFAKMRIDPANPSWKDRDRLVVSKGHCAPALYAALSLRGFFPEEELLTFRQAGGRLQGHPDMRRTPGVDLSTGSLGMGLSAGLGMALAARLNGRDHRTYVLLGDGELQEGQVWEAIMAAAKFGVDRCIAIVDHNGVQLDGTLQEVMPMGDLASKWEAFGWRTIEIDGHDVVQVASAIDQVKAARGTPTVIIARTVKGRGVSFMEGKYQWHGKLINANEYAQALKELEG